VRTAIGIFGTRSVSRLIWDLEPSGDEPFWAITFSRSHRDGYWLASAPHPLRPRVLAHPPPRMRHERSLVFGAPGAPPPVARCLSVLGSGRFLDFGFLVSLTCLVLVLVLVLCSCLLACFSSVLRRPLVRIVCGWHARLLVSLSFVSEELFVDVDI
jgi:hypothetical protein